MGGVCGKDVGKDETSIEQRYKISIVCDKSKDTFSSPFLGFGLPFCLQLQPRDEKIGLYLGRQTLVNFPVDVNIKYTLDVLGTNKSYTSTNNFGGNNESLYWGWNSFLDKNESKVADNGTIIVDVKLEVDDEESQAKIAYYIKNQEELKIMPKEAYDKLIAPLFIKVKENAPRSEFNSHVAVIYDSRKATKSMGFGALGLTFYLKCKDARLFLEKKAYTNFPIGVLMGYTLTILGSDKGKCSSTSDFGGNKDVVLIMNFAKEEIRNLVADNGTFIVDVKIRADGRNLAKINYFLSNEKELQSMQKEKYEALITSLWPK